MITVWNPLIVWAGVPGVMPKRVQGKVKPPPRGLSVCGSKSDYLDQSRLEEKKQSAGDASPEWGSLKLYVSNQ